MNQAPAVPVNQPVDLRVISLVKRFDEASKPN
jgi:hypothetical protein